MYRQNGQIYDSVIQIKNQVNVLIDTALACVMTVMVMKAGGKPMIDKHNDMEGEFAMKTTVDVAEEMQQYGYNKWNVTQIQ